MKKLSIIALVVLIALSFACLTACNNDAEYYGNLNAMVKSSYSKVVLTVNSKGYAELNAKFECSYDNGEALIEYSYDKLAQIEVGDDGEIFLPENAVETISGTAIVKDGVITEINESEMEISVEQISASGLRFDVKNFSNVKKKDNSFSAKVNDPKAFMGYDGLYGTDMSVTVEFLNNQTYSELVNGILSVKTGSVLSKIVITYFDTDSNADVTLTYEFTK